ncbi:MAG TPA: response regulator [Thermotogota bacterium]|nr:response regulator [Thermotogota bacterium]HRW93603.1 response regulator [Thermotogota bacterium]
MNKWEEQLDRSILLVEDNADDEMLIVRAIRKGQIANRIDVAHDGKEALDFLLDARGRIRWENVPQVVLLDLKLPKISGLEVLERIRQVPELCTLPVVVLTSSDEERDIVQSYNLGANSYVKKPVDTTEFTRAITEMGLYWLIINRTV